MYSQDKQAIYELLYLQGKIPEDFYRNVINRNHFRTIEQAGMDIYREYLNRKYREEIETQIDQEEEKVVDGLLKEIFHP